jgi:hypothetical protein
LYLYSFYLRENIDQKHAFLQRYMWRRLFVERGRMGEVAEGHGEGTVEKGRMGGGREAKRAWCLCHSILLYDYLCIF